MKEFMTLTKEMLKIENDEKYTKRIEIDVEVPGVVKELYDEVYNYVWEKLLIFIDDQIENNKGKGDLKTALTSYWCKENGKEFSHLISEDLFQEFAEESEGERLRSMENFLRERILIAGGAVSDLVLNKYHEDIKVDMKDIDFFISDELSSLLSNPEYNADGIYVGRLGRFTKKVFSNRVESLDVPILTSDNFSAYGFDYVKEVLKTDIDGLKVDFVLEESDYYEKNFVRTFDFYFRAFSYNGKVVSGTPKALENIKKKEIDIQNLSSPYSSLVRYSSFLQRYGFEENKRTEDFLVLTILMQDSETIVAYLRDHKYEEATPGPRIYFNGSTSLSIEEALQTYILSNLVNIERYKGESNEVIKEAMYKKLSLIVKNSLDRILAKDEDSVLKYGRLSEVLPFETPLSDVESKLAFFLESKAYLYSGEFVTIDNFGFDTENFLNGDSFFDYDEDNEYIKDIRKHLGDYREVIQIKKAFSDKDKVGWNPGIDQDLLSEEIKNELNFNDIGVISFIGPELLGSLYCYGDNLNAISRFDRFKEGTRWSIHCVHSNEIKMRLHLTEGYFIKGDMRLAYEYASPLEENLINANDWDHLITEIMTNEYIEKIDAVQEDPNLRMLTFNVGLVLNKEKNFFKLDELNRYSFNYLNGSRYKKLSGYIKKMSAGVNESAKIF